MPDPQPEPIDVQVSLGDQGSSLGFAVVWQDTDTIWRVPQPRRQAVRSTALKVYSDPGNHGHGKRRADADARQEAGTQGTGTAGTGTAGTGTAGSGTAGTGAPRPDWPGRCGPGQCRPGTGSPDRRPGG